MTELSPEARRLLETIEVRDATTADEARVRAALERSLGVALAAAAVTSSAPAAASVVAAAQVGPAAQSAGGVVTATGASAGATSAGSVATAVSASWLTVSLTGLLAVAVGAGVTAAVMTAASPGKHAVASSPRGELPPAPPSRTEAEPPSPASARTEDPTEESPATEFAPGLDLSADGGGGPMAFPRPSSAAPTQPRRPLRSPSENSDEDADPRPAPAVLDVSSDGNTRRAPPTPTTCDRSSEVASLDRAERALELERPAEAMAELEAFYRTCPMGVWDRRAWVTRVSALCALGQFSQATALMGWYVAEHPQDADLAPIARWCPRDVLSSSR